MQKLEYLITVVVPLYNDASELRGFAEKLVDTLEARFTNFEILLVDNGSTDDTNAIIDSILAEVKCIRYIRLGRHVSREAAIGISLNTAIGDYVVTMCPHTDPIEMVPVLLEKAMGSRHGVVLALQNKPAEALYLRMLKGAVRWYCNRFMQIKLPRNFGLFMVLNRQTINNLTKGRGNDRFARAMAYDRDEITYDPAPHAHADSETLISRIESTADILESNSTHPLFIVTVLGFLASIVNVAYGLYLAVSALSSEGGLQGWHVASLQTSVMFFFLFLLMIMLSEYLGKLFNELIGKEYDPIMQEKTSSVLLANEEMQNVLS